MEDEPLQKLKKMKLSKQKVVEIKKIMKKQWKEIWKNYIHKDFFGRQTIKMHYDGQFFVLMVIKKLI
jgi:hypothetical protein